MLILDIFAAIAHLGLPVLVLTWWIMSRLYNSGQLERGHDLHNVKFNLKALKKGLKKSAQRSEKKSEKKSSNEVSEEAPEKTEKRTGNTQATVGYLEKRWMKFGGGFYGLTALVTFIAIEIADTTQFIVHFPGLAELFKAGIISFLVGILVNQIQNFVTALVWFTYWLEGDRHILVWVLVPYASYLLGLKLASRSFQAWRDALNNSPPH